MLPKRNRLTHTREFARVRRFGRSAHTPLMALYVLPTGQPESRAGFSVSKKVGKAVVRNRVKRLMREAVRHELPELRRGLDMVFIARAPAAEATYGQIVEATGYVLRKCRAYEPAAVEARNA